jgi:outer membrane protein assembly factor BamB
MYQTVTNAILSACLIAVTNAQSWPAFRGPSASGQQPHADGPAPPTTWDVPQRQNVKWATPLPGLGHSSPVVWGNRVFVTTAVSSGDRIFRPKIAARDGEVTNVDSAGDEPRHAWKLICLDLHTGNILWERVAHEGVPRIKRHLKNSHASATAVTDGRRVLAYFGSEGLHAYDMDGRLLWRADLGMVDVGWPYDPDYQWGVASSPVIHGKLVIVQCDNQEDSFIAAYDLETGRQVWRTARAETPSWGTPTVVEGRGRTMVVTNATEAIRAYDANSGKELWSLSGNSELTAPTPIAAHGLVFVTSGYRPIQPIYAIRVDASGDISLKAGATSNAGVVWSTTRGGPYLPTPIVIGDVLYVALNNGIVTAYEALTGQRIYQQRVANGAAISASPVASHGRIYLASEDGDVYVIRAGRQFELLATNRVGDVVLATPAISDGMILIRTDRQLVALSESGQTRQ